MSIFGKTKSEVRMTEGSIVKLLVNFTLPLLVGNLFQQFYNMVDTWVVGNFVGDNAFSAVGTVAPILNLYIFLFTGFANGGAVIVSQFFGAKDKENVKKSVHTMLVITIAFSVVLSIAGYFSLPLMLKIAKSPAGIYDEQMTYLKIIFAFLSFQIIYNMAAAILRAVGDSTRPFIYLVAACIINIGLDLLFVIKFNMGVAGVAWATIIAQGVAAILCLVTMFTTKSDVRINLIDLKYDTILGKQVFLLGLPTALQQMVTSFSNIFVQGYINGFGGAVMGGWTCYFKVDQFAMLPLQSMSIAVQTFVGQNLGAGDEERAKKGLRQATYLCMGVTLVIVAVILVFARPVSNFFTSSESIIEYGVYFIYRITPFMILACPSMVTLSALRGAGNSKMPMIFTLFSYVVFRQIYLFTVTGMFPDNLTPVAFAYPIGWVLCLILVMSYYLKVGFGVKGSIAHKQQK